MGEVLSKRLRCLELSRNEIEQTVSRMGNKGGGPKAVLDRSVDSGCRVPWWAAEWGRYAAGANFASWAFEGSAEAG